MAFTMGIFSDMRKRGFVGNDSGGVGGGDDGDGGDDGRRAAEPAALERVLHNKTPAPLENPRPAGLAAATILPVPETLPPVDNAMDLTPSQILMLKQTLFNEATAGDTSAARIKAATVLLEYNLMTRHQKVREGREGAAANAVINNVIQVVNHARSVTDTYERPITSADISNQNG